MVRLCVAGSSGSAVPHMLYKDAISKYAGQADLRFGMNSHEVTNVFHRGKKKLQIEGMFSLLLLPAQQLFAQAA